MVPYRPLYDPPVSDDIEKLRQGNFASEDQELYLHVGHFVSWYGAAEFMLGIYLQMVTQSSNAARFHILTRGMDVKVKVERLRQACAEAGIVIGTGLNERLDHFAGPITTLRNKLVHNHLYWPKNGPLQICSIGTPPIYEDLRLPASDPETIDGLTIFERGIWLNLFGYDLGQLHLDLELPIRRLERDAYQSPLPTGAHPSPQPQSGRAKSGKHTQKPGLIRRILLNARKALRRVGVWPRHFRGHK